MVREIIKLQSPDAMVRLVHASKSKRARAEPVALLYTQNRVCHANHFPALEDEMCSFGTQNFRGSPNRMDALVWALSHLLLGQNTAPNIRPI
jgi:phage terminase large subunit-like protein